jgi:hypothetical protein
MSPRMIEHTKALERPHIAIAGNDCYPESLC